MDGLVYDGDALGHRRNFLDPSISTSGVGAVPKTAIDADLVLHPDGPDRPTAAARPPVRSGFVAWPPAGFVPYQVVPARWSFSLPNTNFANATVTMQRNGASVPVQIRCFDPWPDPNDEKCGQFGESAILWTANNVRGRRDVAEAGRRPGLHGQREQRTWSTASPRTSPTR